METAKRLTWTNDNELRYVLNEEQRNFERVTIYPKIEDLKNLMASGIANFSYRKKDGSLREAYGTRCPGLIPEKDKDENANKGSRKNPDTFPYYDLEKKEWRCFRTFFICDVSKDYDF